MSEELDLCLSVIGQDCRCDPKFFDRSEVTPLMRLCLMFIDIENG